MRLLPEVRDRYHYAELFKEDQAWVPAIECVIRKHGLIGMPERGTLGSHIVYRVGNCWVKFMAPLFAKDMLYEISGLKAVERRLSVPTPEIQAEGVLEDWPYVILSHIEGKPIRDLWESYPPENQLKLATQAARICKEIGRCSSDQTIRDRFDWNDFIASQFIEVENQQVKKSLPEGWLKRVQSFLHSFDVTEFQTSSPVFLHADLTGDHFMVASDGSPELTGVIDLADCQTGHFEYELVAPCAFIFKSNLPVLKAFLMACGFQEHELNQRFSEKLLAWSLLHRYFGMVTRFKEELSSLPAGDFSQLAARVYPLD